jgi:hypothetical protein
MELIRLDPSPKLDMWPDDHSQVSYALETVSDKTILEDAKAVASFPRFGRGEQRRSDFRVELNWIDVKGLVKAFIEMEHPEALYLDRAIRLVKKMEDSGWHNDDLPDEEFWEILP